MAWNTQYLPPDPALWQGRADTPADSSFFQITKMLDLREDKSVDMTQPTFALLGFQCDEGIRRNLGRTGAAEGPAALKQTLARLPIQKSNFHVYDAGTITCPNEDLETAQTALGETIRILLQKNIKPIALGGGHELAWGHYQGIAAAYPDKKLGIINFDAHFDMRPLLPGNKGSSGTPFLQIAQAHEKSSRLFDYNCIGIQHAGNIRQLFETAKHYNTKIIWADEIHQGQLQKSVDFVDRIIDENEIIYLSLCLDVFAAAFAPGVSAIQPLGLFPWHVIPLVRQLAASGKVVSYDIVELSPRYDIDQCTTKLAANFIYEIIHHHSGHPLPW
jgi:formiminoglutamase